MTAKNVKHPSISGDRYYTPEWVVGLCFDHVVPKAFETRWPESILEPSAGQGVFVRAARQRYRGARIVAVDVDPTVGLWSDADQSVTGDFLAYDTTDRLVPDRFDLVIGNPPFSFALPFVERSLLRSRVVIFLVRQGFLSSAKRCRFFREHPPLSVHLLSNRPAFATPDGPPIGTDTADYCFVTWLSGYTGETTLHWLPEMAQAVRRTVSNV